MTKLLACAVVLLVCGEQVRAEGRSVKEQAPVPYGALAAPSPPGEPNEKFWQPCSHLYGPSHAECRIEGDKIRVRPTQTACEAKMKEAMKSILPYIDYGDTISSTDAAYRTPQTRLREEADRMDRRDAALRKWNAIYEECVK